MAKTSKLTYKNKTILPQMKVATNPFELANGLMFASKKKIDKGICLVLPSSKDVRFGASITMMFCFHPLEILFINSKFEIVDKKILKPWAPSYTPKEACKYVIESTVGKFESINIGDKVQFKL